MRRQRQLPPDEPEYLPSTTRAVAWGALFFAFLSFIMSTTTLVLTYKDGRLARNAGELLEQARLTIDKAREKDTAAATDDESASQRNNVSHQLDRYVEMIEKGDSQARFYLDGLRGDLEKLRAYGSEHGKDWISDASATIDSAREELTKNRPEAAKKLQGLADRLSTTVKDFRENKKTNDPAAEKTSPDSTSEPVISKPSPMSVEKP